MVRRTRLVLRSSFAFDATTRRGRHLLKRDSPSTLRLFLRTDDPTPSPLPRSFPSLFLSLRQQIRFFLLQNRQGKTRLSKW